MSQLDVQIVPALILDFELSKKYNFHMLDPANCRFSRMPRSCTDFDMDTKLIAAKPGSVWDRDKDLKP